MRQRSHRRLIHGPKPSISEVLARRELRRVALEIADATVVVAAGRPRIQRVANRNTSAAFTDDKRNFAS
jgi:hypothetical protein